jgi:hypothetical protein
LFRRIENGLKQILPFIHHSDAIKKTSPGGKKGQPPKKTLGVLVGEFVESVDCNVDYFSVQLEKMVDERNRLLHHFSDSDDLDMLHTEEGCRTCIASLEAQRQEAYAFYEVIQLFGFGLFTFLRERLSQPSQEIELLYKNIKSSLLTEVEYINLSKPSETIWGNTKIVKLLRLAELNTDRDNSMTSLSKAEKFIRQQDVECTPESYGIKTLKGILTISGLFEIIEEQDVKQKHINILYRSKT